MADSVEKKPTPYKDAAGKTVYIGSKVKFAGQYFEVEVNPFNNHLVIDSDTGQTDLIPILDRVKVMPDLDAHDIDDLICQARNSFINEYYTHPTCIFLGQDLVEVLTDDMKLREYKMYIPKEIVPRGASTVLTIMGMVIIAVAEDGHVSAGIRSRIR